MNKSSVIVLIVNTASVIVLITMMILAIIGFAKYSSKKGFEQSVQWTPEQTNRVFAVYYYNYSPFGKEAKWSSFLAKKLKEYHGEQEVKVPYGRIDVETDIMSIEVDKIMKWHEGIGQCLHYAHYTHKTPALAIIAPKPKDEYERDRFTTILDVCETNGIKVILMTQGK